jgi:hypothetical protein
MPSHFISESISVSDDALASFASELKFQVVGEKLIAVEAYAVQCQAMLEQAK